MRLYLCRHAEAVDNSGEPSIDEDRWLTEHGRAQALSIGKALRKEGIQFDALFTSPLVRAVQTADLLAAGLHFDQPVRVLRPLAPGGALGQLLSSLEGLVAEDEGVAVVGHEPQLSEWAATLLGQHSFGRSFKKGAVLCLEWDGWAEAGSAHGVFFMTPKGLKPEPL